MSLMIDIHCHLDHPKFKDLDRVVENARKAGVKMILTNGVDHETNKIALQLSSKYDIVKAALGVYPLFGIELGVREGAYPMDKVLPVDVDHELKFIESNKDKIIAVGEVGLDYTVKGKEKEQKENFEKIIKLGEKIKKPLVVHSRKAEEDVVDMIESSSVKKVLMHCFCGKKKLIKRAYDLGCYFSVPTNVARAQNFQMLVEMVNLSHLFCETDAPYLSPFKDKQNEPAFVVESYKKIAEIKKMELKEVVNNIWMNFDRLFE
ncbi:MAG: TatD family hydrolase [Nanoarchaeota archaeon]|nr:TatD family hydrolase [Nanoarchaeota archaeon]